MNENKDIELSKGNLWLVIVTGGNYAVHHEVKSYHHANNIIRGMVFGPSWPIMMFSNTALQFFTQEDVEANSLARGRVYQQFDGRSFVAYLLDDRERYNFLIERMK